MQEARSAISKRMGSISSQKRRPDVQGLRAVAVLIVVAFHADLPLTGGFVGVDVFFVISGFVITSMLHREWSRAGRINHRRFYLNRFKRLSPALAVTLTVTMLVSIIVLSPFGSQQTAAKTAIGAIFLLANLVIARSTGGYFAPAAENNPLLNTWSLSVEEQFYLVFPLLIALGWYLASRRGAFRLSPVIIVGGVAVVSFALTLASANGVTFPYSDWILGFYSPFTRAWEFAVGALLALAVASNPSGLIHRVPVQLNAISALVGLVMLAASLSLITESTVFPGPWTLLPITGTLLLLFAGTQTNKVSQFLSTRPMVRIGDWSYSIYLWHWPFIVFTMTIWPGSTIAVLIAVFASFVPAVLSYYWIEQPFRSIAAPSLKQLILLMTISVVVPLTSAAFLLVGSRAAWWTTWPDEPVQDSHAALANCTDRPFDPIVCTWNKDLMNGQVLVVGDSQAYAAADGVIEAAKSLGFSTIVSSRSGCPWSSLDSTGVKPYNCPAWQRQILEFSLATKPKVVVIANRSAGYTNTGWRSLIKPDGTPADPSKSDEVVPLYESGLADMVAELRRAQIGVVILQNIPEPENLRRSTSILQKLLPSADTESFDPARSMERMAAVAAAERRVAAAHPGTTVLNPADWICDKRSCPLRTVGRPVYLDPWHLTREGSLLLTPGITEALRKTTAT